MSDPLVSILVPVYNREGLISQTIDSAISQSYKNIEIVIVDNCSTDRTWEILEKYSQKDGRIRVLRNKTNVGPVRNWKRCIDEAKGEYGKILWSDDLISPKFVENTLPFLQEDADVGFVFSGAEIFEEKTGTGQKAYFIGKSGLYSSEKYIKGVLFGGQYPVSPGCALFRMDDLCRNLMVHIPNKVESDFSMHAIGNDLLIFLLTAHQYSKFGFVNKPLAFFRDHPGSITISSEKGKIPLHYDLAKAYFVEKFRPDLVRQLNTAIWIHLKRFKDSCSYGLRKCEDFYIGNEVYSLDHAFFLKRICYFLRNKSMELFHR